jgi:FkbM family methyltransferase
MGEERYLVSSNDKVIGRQAFVAGTFDFDKFKKVCTLIGEDFDRKLLIDIGANIGTICIPAVKRNLFREAIAFEPDLFNYSLLVANIYINNIADRVFPHNLALGANVGEDLVLELSESSYGDHRIRISKVDGLNDEAHRKTIRVQGEPLDSLIDHIDPISTLIWMDTQGFEGFVLKGADRILRTRPPLVIEFWPYGMKRTNSYEQLKESICRAGYEMVFDLNSEAAPAPVSRDAFDILFDRIGEEGEFTDLLII